jgi:hypothetical protein
MVTFSWCWKQISFADQIGAGVLFIPGWFDIALNDLTSYSIARRVLGKDDGRLLGRPSSDAAALLRHLNQSALSSR